MNKEKKYKEIRICNYCKCHYEAYISRVSKYCSRNCYELVPKITKGIKRPDITKRNKEYYKNTSKDILQKRWDNIGKARERPLTDSEILALKEVVSWKYVVDRHLLLKHANLPDSYCKRLANYINNNLDWWENAGLYKYIPRNIQEWSKEKFDLFCKESHELDHRKMKEKYGLKNKAYHTLSVRGIIEKKRIENNYIGESKPERIVKELLIKHNILFIKQKYMNNMKFRVDFLIDKKVIEVNGDYWHTNPKIYIDGSKLTSVQISNKERDIKKLKWLKENDYDVLIIWEDDIKTQINIVEKQLLEWLKTKK